MTVVRTLLSEVNKRLENEVIVVTVLSFVQFFLLPTAVFAHLLHRSVLMHFSSSVHAFDVLITTTALDDRRVIMTADTSIYSTEH